jgi:hypothetical protein
MLEGHGFKPCFVESRIVVRCRSALDVRSRASVCLPDGGLLSLIEEQTMQLREWLPSPLGGKMGWS